MTDAFALPDAGRGGALAGVVVVELRSTPRPASSRAGSSPISGPPSSRSSRRPARRCGSGGPASTGRTRSPSSRRTAASTRCGPSSGELATEPWLARLLATADALIEDLGPGRLEAAGLSPEALERAQPAARHPAHLAVRPDRAAGRRARRRPHRPGLLRRAVRDRVPGPRAAAGHGAAGRELDRHPRRERAPDGDLPRPAERPRPGRGHRPLPDRAADAGRGGRPPRPDRGGGRAPRHRVAHRGPRQRLPDARRRMDRGLRRGRPALRPPLRGDRGARRAEGSALRHPRRASAEPGGLGRAGRLLDRPARPGRRRGALRAGRRGRHRGALRRRHPRPTRT